MYLTFIIYTSYFFTILFIALLVKTFWQTPPGQIWHNAKQKVYFKRKLKNEHDKAIEKGLKPFHFRNGTITIYAKTQLSAAYQFRLMREAERVSKKRESKPKSK